METIKVKGELLFELSSEQDWVNRVPYILPEKQDAQQLLWVDINGNVFTTGLDFKAATLAKSYPCKVYRLRRVSQIIC